jgi:phytoene synthase
LNVQDGSLQKKTSFYYPLLLLPKAQRRAMETLYRFCWAADEISDGPGSPAQKKKALAVFRSQFKTCLKGRGRAQDPLFEKLKILLDEFQLSAEPLNRVLQGVERDLRPVQFKTFAQLHDYARQVAGGPGLASMEIFGFKDPAHRLYAENLGVFLQIINIVRDVQEDAQMGRRYLPAEDFRRFRLKPERLDPRDLSWKNFVDFQLDRAETFWTAAQMALSRKERGELPTAEAIAAVYGRLNEKLRSCPEKILTGKMKLSVFEKLSAVGKAIACCALWKRFSS